MTHRRAPALAQLLLIGLAAAACADAALTQPEPPVARDIVDAPRSAAGKGFYFLPPLVASPTSFSGAFDPAANPVVEVCLPFGKGCSLPLVARFVMGNGADHIRVDATAEHYNVNWHTRNYTLDAARTYRIRVRVGLNDLGYADVKLVRNGNEAKAVDASKYVAVNLGSTQPIKFRIEKGAIPPAGAPALLLDASAGSSAAIGSGGGTITVITGEDVRYTFTVPAGALTTQQTIRMTPITRMSNVPTEGGLIAGVHFEPDGVRFAKAAVLRIDFPAAFVNRTNLTGFTLDGSNQLDIAPARVEGSSITLPVLHFSAAGAAAGTAAAVGVCVVAGCLAERQAKWELQELANIAFNTGTSINRADVVAVFRKWAASIVSELNSANSEPTVQFAELHSGNWSSLANYYAVANELSAEFDQIIAAIGAMYKRRIDALDGECRSTKDESLRRTAQSYAHKGEGLGLVLGAGYAPDEVDIWHCGTPVVHEINLPSPLDPGSEVTASVTVGVKYTNEFVWAKPLKLTVVINGSNADDTYVNTVEGTWSKTLAAKATASNVALSATACFNGPPRNGLCDTKTAMAVVKKPITVTISPPTGAQTKTNQPFAFGAIVTNATNTSVTWSADGGTITAAGVFTATTAGDYTVTASSVEDPSKKASAPIKVTADGVARLTVVSCDLGFAGAATSFSAGESMSLPRCSLDAPAATGTVSSSGSGPTGSASASVTTTMSAAGAGDQGKFSKLTVRAATVGTINATGNSVCTDQCSDAMANFTGSIGIVVTADAPVILEVNLTSLQACGGNMANGWQAFAQNYNRHSWLGCNTTDVFVIRLGAGQSWDYAIGTEMWLKNAAYGKNGSVGYSMRGTVTLEITVKPQ